MRRFSLHLSILALAALLTACNGERVRLPVSRQSQATRLRTKVDPHAFASPVRALRYQVEAPVGYAAAVQNPLEGLVVDSRIRWNGTVELLQQAFRDLARDHNEGRVSIQEFQQRRDQLQSIGRSLEELKAGLDAALEAYRAARVRLRSEGQEAATARAEMQKLRGKIDALLEAAGDHGESLKTTGTD